MNKLSESKHCVGPGWHFLTKLLNDFVEMKQKGWLLKKDGKFSNPEKDLFDFEVYQQKEKYARYRIYAECLPVDHDWSVFDEKSYLDKLGVIQIEVQAYIAALEDFSGYICEESGDRGTMRNIGGWYKTLSDREFEIALGKRNLQTLKDEVKTDLAETLEKFNSMTQEEKVAAADNFFGKLEDLDKENAKK